MNDGPSKKMAFADSELEAYLLRLVDDEISDSDFSVLVAALQNSPELRKRAARFLHDESLLIDEIGTTQAASKLMAGLGAENRTSHKANRTGHKTLSLKILHYVNSKGVAIAAVAMIVIASLVAHNLTIMSKVADLHSLAVEGADPGEVEVVVDTAGTESTVKGLQSQQDLGRVIGLRGIEQLSTSVPLAFGDSLKEGQRIQLSAGVLEILLSSGAKVTAEGPVDFELSTLLSMQLDKGKVVAAVPRTARGYTIITPTSEVVDIGTQFGLAVDDAGDTALHVFDGEVVARSRMKDVDTDLIHARENESLMFEAQTIEPRRIAKFASDFTRWIGPTIDEKDLPQIPAVENLAVWYLADMISDVHDGEIVSIWRDILVGDNKFANDARQFDARRCPTLVVDERGRKALRFNGTSTSLQTDPIVQEDCMTVFVAFTPELESFSSEYHGGMLFKFGSVPTLEMSVLSDRSTRGWVWTGSHTKNVGVAQSSAIDRIPAVMCYQYNRSEAKARLWLNGIQQNSVNSSTALREHDYAYIGSHNDQSVDAFFNGIIYEMAIYSGVLKTQAIEDLHRYFNQRYQTE